jgi:hypothetical protein
MLSLASGSSMSIVIVTVRRVGLAYLCNFGSNE